MVILQIKAPLAVAGLFMVLFSQMVAYNLFFDPSFLLVATSLAGGLLILLASSSSLPSKSMLPGLPEVVKRDKRAYLQLFGRIMLVFLYFDLVYDEDMSVFAIILAVLGFCFCAFLVVGFHTRQAALVALLLLLAINIAMNNWWALRPKHPRRDYMRYEFFQILSVGGGLLLLADQGPGGISLDKKEF